MIKTYPQEIPQFLEAMTAALSKRESPIMAMSGAMVSGVTYRRKNPMMPGRKVAQMMVSGSGSCGEIPDLEPKRLG